MASGRQKQKSKHKRGHRSLRHSNAVTSGTFRMVVAANPGSGMTVVPELDLVKAALLYGDKVTLISPVRTMLLRVEGLRRFSPRQQIELVRRVAPILMPAQTPEFAPAALVARARTRMQEYPGAFRGGDPRADLGAVVVAWADRRPWTAPHPNFTHPEASQPVTADDTFWGKPWTGDIRPVLSAFIAGRFWEAARRPRNATHQPRSPCRPTRTGGSLPTY